MVKKKYNWGNVNPEIMKLLEKDANKKQTTKYMLEAIKEAKKGKIKQKKVGVVLVKDNKIICRAYRGKLSRNHLHHAEYVALKKSKTNILGASLYVTLEPCNVRKHGKDTQKPCVTHIINSGIKKVYIGLPDTGNPEISGGGIKKLVEAGIKVYASPKILYSKLYKLIPDS